MLVATMSGTLMALPRREDAPSEKAARAPV
jgi:hypothetical protein